MDRWRRWRLLLGAGIVLALVLGVAAGLLLRSQERSRDDLEDRFALRGTLAAHFAESYAGQLFDAERRWARRALSRRAVARADFERVVEAFEFEAAVLLDERGRVLRAWPHDPSVLGSELASRYDHLGRALAGEPAVSSVVPSAVEGRPIVAFAVPYETRSGRRVLSGAFALERSPLAAYLRNALPVAGSRLYVVDEADRLVVTSEGDVAHGTLEAVDPALAAAILEGPRGTAADGLGRRFYAVQPVRSTPWRVVVSAPEAQLFEPVSGLARWAPWLLFTALALACAAAAALLLRLVTQRARLAEANAVLARTNDELEQLDRLKDEFVALVSHELRTPLTSVMGYVRLLLRGRAGELTAEQRRLLEVADRNAQRLLALVGDLLFAAKADAGKLDLELGEEDLAAIVDGVVESALPDARERSIELRAERDASLPLVADRSRLAQLLDNLVSNALKFTPAGGAVVVRAHAEGDSAVVEVEDSGIGIAPDEVERLFERFFRASTATAREIQGTGLGLSVVKTIAELHGGSVTCTSEEGRGTTFRVVLPLAALQAAAAA